MPSNPRDLPVIRLEQNKEGLGRVTVRGDRTHNTKDTLHLLCAGSKLHTLEALMYIPTYNTFSGQTHHPIAVFRGFAPENNGLDS